MRHLSVWLFQTYTKNTHTYIALLAREIKRVRSGSLLRLRMVFGEVTEVGKVHVYL